MIVNDSNSIPYYSESYSEIEYFINLILLQNYKSKLLMSLDDKFIPIRTGFYEMVDSLFKKIAGLFGYPANPGMARSYHLPDEASVRSRFLENLPSHQTFWPPIQRPENWFETIVGPSPKIDGVPRYVYENREEGFYNFYIENFKNIYFLPDWFSEFLQVRLNFCLDITLLETIREVLFIGLVIYSNIVILRITLSWFISINPYKVPWSYVVAAVDWTEEVLQGVVPAILGVNITGTIFLGILGVLADSLNHLVFTMPFLPSEAEESKLIVQQQMKDVLIFHYLPILWYRYPIPNEIREYWYNERPEILDYMQKAYQDSDIQFLPDSIVQQLNQEKLTADLPQIHNSLSEMMSTEILSKYPTYDRIPYDRIQGVDFISSIHSLNEYFHHFW
jgi:uncharacterized protein YggT (Ycf19 family)